MEREAAIGATFAPITTGVSQKTDPAAAADEFYRDVWRPGIDTALFFCSPQYDLPALERALDERFRGVRLVGCTTAGEITPRGYLQGAISGIGFVRRRLPWSRSSPSPVCGRPASPPPRGGPVGLVGARREAAQPAAGHDLRPAADRRPLGREEQVVSAIGELGDMPLVGGSAGDDLNFRCTWIFYGAKFVTNAAVLLLISTPAPRLGVQDRAFRADRPTRWW